MASNNSGASSSNSTFSLLLDMPPELRNMVYRAVLVSQDPIEVATTKKRTQNFSSGIQLLQTCHQIHAEAHQILPRENTFQITAYDMKFENSRNWLKGVTREQAKLIKNLTISIQFSQAFKLHLQEKVGQIQPDYEKICLEHVGGNVRRLVVRRVPASAIELVSPSTLDSSAAAMEHALFRVHEEFNKLIEEVLREPHLKIEKQLSAGDYQMVMTTKVPNPIRKVHIANTDLTIADAYVH